MLPLHPFLQGGGAFINANLATDIADTMLGLQVNSLSNDLFEKGYSFKYEDR